MDDESNLVTPQSPVDDEVQDDRGSNNSVESSHSSEEFVKVTPDDPTLAEHDAGDMPRHEDVEEVPPVTEEPPSAGKFPIHLDPREAESDKPPSVIPQGSHSEVKTMSSEQEHQEELGDADFKPEEAEPEPLIKPEQPVDEAEDVAPVESTPPEQEEEDIVTVPEVKEEVRDSPAPVVEEIDTKPEPVPIMSQCPTAVVDLIYWRDIKKTAFVFTTLLVVLGSLTVLSIIAVMAYSGLALLSVTVAFRLYKVVLQTLNGTQQPHPFQALLDSDVTISQERVQKYSKAVLGHLNCFLTEARDLFLVKNTINSLKFGVFLWLMTYIGCCFNGLTLLIIDVILIFTLPPFYEKYQTQIDHYYGIARDKVSAAVAAAKAKMPGSKQPKEKAQ